MPGLQTSPPVHFQAPRARHAYARRWSTSLVMSLGLHAAAFLITARLLHGGDPGGGNLAGADAGGGTGGTTLEGVLLQFPPPSLAAAASPALDPTPVAVQPEPDVVPSDVAVLPEIEVSPSPPTPGTSGDATAAASGAGAAAGAGGGAGGGTAGGAGGPGDAGPAQPIEVAYDDVQLRLFAPPHMPDVVVKRKISGSVSLRALVGIDGSVQDVEVLRDIPNCSECTRASVDAAYRVRFDPIFVDGHPTPFWTAWEYTFGVKPTP